MFSNSKLPLKFYKRSNMYKASNVTFNPETKEAFSYNWWKFVDVINGAVVFNTYGYSPSTRKHQYKVERLLEQLGINVDVYIQAPQGLQANLDSSRRYHREQYNLAHEKAKKARKAHTLQWQLDLIDFHAKALLWLNHPNQGYLCSHK